MACSRSNSIAEGGVPSAPGTLYWFETRRLEESHPHFHSPPTNAQAYIRHHFPFWTAKKPDWPDCRRSKTDHRRSPAIIDPIRASGRSTTGSLIVVNVVKSELSKKAESGIGRIRCLAVSDNLAAIIKTISVCFSGSCFSNDSQRSVSLSEERLKVQTPVNVISDDFSLAIDVR